MVIVVVVVVVVVAVSCRAREQKQAIPVTNFDTRQLCRVRKTMTIPEIATPSATVGVGTVGEAGMQGVFSRPVAPTSKSSPERILRDLPFVAHLLGP